MGPKKQIHLPTPNNEPVNITDYLPIIDHPLFQLLKRKRQTGLLFEVFTSSTHSRFEHSLGSMQLAQIQTTNLGLSPEDKRAVEIVALIHDWRHLPCSHDIEPFLAENHNDRGRKELKELYDAIAKCGADPEKVQAIYDEIDPLHVLIKHGVFGVDKLDYTWRDSHHISLKNQPPVMEILYHLKYHDGQLCIHPKGAQEADMAQHHYFDLHKKAYFNKKYIVYKRMLQLAVQTAITQDVLRTKRSLIEYSDDGLLLLLIDSEHPGVAQLGRAITNHGDAYQTSLAWKIGDYVKHEAVVDGTKKPIVVYSLDQDTRKRFSHSQLATPKGLLELEEKLREEFDCNLGDIIVTTIFEFDRYRDPRDIHIYDGDREPRSLLTEDGPRADSLRALADSAFSIRVASTPKLRKEIYQNRKNVKVIVEEAIASSQSVQINLT